MDSKFKPDERLTRDQIAAAVAQAVSETQVDSIHTHLFPASSGPKLALLGWDEMLNYHYLSGVAQTDLNFWDPQAKTRLLAATGTDRARIIHAHHFKNPRGVLPLSEQAKGVNFTLQALGIDPNGSFDEIKAQYDAQTEDPEAFIERILKLARVKTVIGTNTITDPLELAWYRSADFEVPPWYQFALRLDALLKFPDPTLITYLRHELDCIEVTDEFNGKTVDSLRELIRDWANKFKARYIAISLEPHFRWDDSIQAQMLRKVVIPAAEELGLPMFLMIEPLRQVDPTMGLAGDASGELPIEVIHRILGDFRAVNFWVMALDQATQYRLMTAKRSQSNLMLWGIWWFLLNPTAMDHIMSLRIEMLGQGCIAAHSDSRVWEQELYKWEMIRGVWTRVLARKIEPLLDTGLIVTYQQVLDTHRGFFDLAPLDVKRPAA